MSEGRSGWLRGAISLGVAALFVALLARQADAGEVWATLRGGDLALLAPAAALMAAHYALKGLRWRALLGPESGLGPLLAVRLTMVGFLMNNLFPARAGELGRPWLLAANRPQVSFSYALATLVGDKIFDLLFTILCLLAASLLLPMPPFAKAGALALSAAGLLAMGGASAAALWIRRGGALPGPIERLAGPFMGALQQFAAGLATASSPRRFAAACAWTAAAFALTGGALVLCMRAVGVPGGLPHAVFVLGTLGIGFAIPSPPTHAGTYHFFAAQALQLSGAAGPEQALSFAVLAHGLQVAVVSGMGLLSTIGLDWRRARGLRDPQGGLRSPQPRPPD